MTTLVPRTRLVSKSCGEPLLSRFVTNGEGERRTTFLIAAVFVGHCPFVAWHLVNLWQKTHYQFFPFLMVGIGWLLWIRWPPSDRDSSRRELRTAHLLPGLIVLCAAVLLFSAWLAAVAAILTAGGVLWSLAGRDGWREWAPVWALLWLLVPAPLGWDDDVVFTLQSIASRASSATLDVLGIRHLLEGHVFELPGHRLFVEEACSGINSLFLLVAATALFVVAVRRPVIWAVLLLTSSAVWAVLVNVGRIVAVALAQAWWDTDLTTEWTHAILGVGAVTLALLMLASTDRLLAFLLGRIDVRDSDGLDSCSSRLVAETPLTKAWNWCVARERGTAPSKPLESRREPVGRPNSKRTRRLKAGCFALLAALQLAALTSFGSRPFVVHPAPFLRSDLFDGFDLPTAFDGWVRMESVTDDQDGGNSSGVYSRTWYYRSGSCICWMSVDYPFPHWHDLSRCYAAQGWTIVDRTVRFSAMESGAANDPHVELQMAKPGDRNGMLLFSMVDEQGNAARIRPHDISVYRKCLRNLNEHPLRWPLEGKALTDSTFQVQAFFSSPERLCAGERQAVRRFFLTARDEIVSAYRTRMRRIPHEEAASRSEPKRRPVPAAARTSAAGVPFWFLLAAHSKTGVITGGAPGYLGCDRSTRDLVRSCRNLPPGTARCL